MQTVDVAIRASLHRPHTQIFLAATLVFLVIAVVAPWIRRDEHGERRLFWWATAAAAGSVFLASLPDWGLGILLSLWLLGMTIFTAYFNGSYIRIRGKVFAFYLSDSLPAGSAENGQRDKADPAPDSYGGMATAKKMWWLNVFAMVICVLNVEPHKFWRTVLAVLVVVGGAALLGYGDASWDYSIARGQRIQFFIVSIITAGVFTGFYLAGFCAGRRWPLRLKQSMEYRAHARHQKRYPP